MNFCVKHKINLVKECPECKELYADIKGQYLSLLPICKNNHIVQVPESECYDSFLMEIIDDFKILIKHYGKLDADLFMDKLIIALGNRGYIHYKGAIDKIRVIEDLFTFFDVSNLEKIGVYKENLVKHFKITKLFTRENMVMVILRISYLVMKLIH
ncbi:hypothetical protein SAMN05443246_4604 [Paenibacillus sp. GP183]|jgi:hypothetical protein|nr:hypothetical protein SAMN05443246_4604 [Paenibacillus sp. GP183]